MKRANRDLLVLLKNHAMSEDAIEQEVECLNLMLQAVESPDEFCNAHELVRRNRITSKKKWLIRASHQYELRPFWFLINKN